MRRLKRQSARLVQFFRRLQWKLTLSYTLVTTVSSVIMVGFGFALLWGLVYTVLPQSLAIEMTSRAAVPTQFLRQNPPAQVDLTRWLEAFAQDNTLNAASSDRTVSLFGEVSVTAVVDVQGHVLAVHPPTAASPGSPLPQDVDTAAHTVVQSALTNDIEIAHLNLDETDALQIDQLAVWGADGVAVAAVPLYNEQDEILGAWLVLVEQNLTASVWGIVLATLGLLIPVALCAAVFAIVAGTLFGFLTARGLTRRLRRMVTVADAWSAGDFTAVVEDKSRDELGQLAQRLNRMAEELHNLFQVRQELATVEERNRLARDLHDSVKQQLFATTMQLGAARALIDHDVDLVENRLSDAERLAFEAQRELTMIIHELRPAALEDNGLAVALKAYVTDWSRHSDIAAHVYYQGEQELSLTREQVIFRVAQEALANVARHSGATSVDVRVTWSPQFVTLTVADNGCGFDPLAVLHNGVGLQSMHERLAALGGTLTVDSMTGKGTRVVALIEC